MINNCFNYVGSKDRIFPIIDKKLDKTKSYFIDLFCGSGVVGINEINNYQKVVLNDACWQMVEVLKYFRDNPYEKVINSIEECIKTYGLSKDNKEGYNKLREDFNFDPYLKFVFDPVMFYCLVTHSFNYNIHINSAGKFSVPSGKGRCYFNKNIKAKLEAFQWELHEHKEKITLKNHDFAKLIEKSDKILSKSMVYVDPPYLSSDDSYSRIYYLGKWTEDKERELYETLDVINEKGGSFLLSNVLENNGEYNKILDTWAQKYIIEEVSTDFTNCNYQRKNAGKTKEILVRNYKI